MATVLIRMESGSLQPHDEPLPDGLSQRIAKGEAENLGPCDEAGNLLATPAEAEAPKRRAVKVS